MGELYFHTNVTIPLLRMFDCTEVFNKLTPLFSVWIFSCRAQEQSHRMINFDSFPLQQSDHKEC